MAFSSPCKSPSNGCKKPTENLLRRMTSCHISESRSLCFESSKVPRIPPHRLVFGTFTVSPSTTLNMRLCWDDLLLFPRLQFHIGHAAGARKGPATGWHERIKSRAPGRPPGCLQTGGARPGNRVGMYFNVASTVSSLSQWNDC